MVSPRTQTKKNQMEPMKDPGLNPSIMVQIDIEDASEIDYTRVV